MVLVALSACGKSLRSDDDVGRAGEAGESSGGTGAATGGSNNEGGSSGSGGMRNPECVVVRRVACCAEPFAVTREEFEADECLLPFDQNLTSSDLLSRCEARRPATCGPENCLVLPPPSRVAVPDLHNVCRFVDECTNDDDCTFASQCCGCCACLEPMPKSRAVAETCVVSEDPAVETEPRECVTCPGGNLCQGCRHEHTMSCSETPRGMRICQWGPMLPTTACTAERDCGGEGLSSDMQCFAPDFNCGGPPPPPNECEVDSDCADGEGRICSPTGYCGQSLCVPGCTSDADCTAAEVCSPTLHCEPRPCTDRSECGPNFECSAEGVCVRSDCVKTTACEGYCVNGRCYDEPGFCMAPPV